MINTQYFKKIAILGGGGIGGSLVHAALANLAESTSPIFDETQFVVYDINPAGAKARLLNSPEYLDSLDKGKITPEIMNQRVKFTNNPRDVAGAELINFAVPVDQYATTAHKIAPYIDPKTTVITDEGSVKEMAINRAIAAFEEHFGKDVPSFVGYHIPFHNYPTQIGFLVETNYSPKPAVEMVENFRKGLGAKKFFRVTAEQHDTLYGTSSHLNYINMSAMLRTEFMRNATVGYVDDPGHWLKSMVSIAHTSPRIWPGIFSDNKKGILKSAQHLRGLLVKHAELLVNGILDKTIDTLHKYAKDKKSHKIFPLPANTPNADLKRSAFAAFFSAAATANIQRLEKETGVTIADYANPSCRQSLGITACDPSGAKALITQYKAEIPSMLADFLRQYDEALETIANADYKTALAFCTESAALQGAVDNGLSVQAANQNTQTVFTKAPIKTIA